jgi:hypothetical protein
MTWWTVLTDKTKYLKNQVISNAAWAWNNTSLSSATKALFNYTVNTTFHVIEEGLALRRAVPTLVNNPAVRKVVGGVGYVIAYDIIPILTLNYVNNSVHQYFGTYNEEEDRSNINAAFISVLKLGNSLVTAYTWQQGIQTCVRVAVLDSVGPPAFNLNKITPPPSLCTDIDLACNGKRKMKGLGRELFILLANDAAIAGISYLPYAGAPLAQVLSVINNGRYITRLVTPERCERHKFMEQESVLALGLTYELSSRLMDYALATSTGTPPWLYLRALRHILLSWHVNLAAHMDIPLVEPKNATLPIDLFNGYERMWRFMIDVIIAGLIKRVPIDFKPEKGAPPLLSLSTALQSMTKMFNNPLESAQPGMLRVGTPLNYLRLWALPPIFHSTDNLLRDPIIIPYWPSLQKGTLETVDMIFSIGQNKVVNKLVWLPKSIATLLDLKYGIPKKLTKILIMLNKEKDFWDLARAIKLWLERHSLNEVTIIRKPSLALHGEKSLEKLPERRINSSPDVSGAQLLTIKKDKEEELAVEQLLSERGTEVVTAILASPSVLFVARQRKLSEPKEELSLSSLADNPEALFSLRRRKPQRIAGVALLTHDSNRVSSEPTLTDLPPLALLSPEAFFKVEEPTANTLVEPAAVTVAPGEYLGAEKQSSAMLGVVAMVVEDVAEHKESRPQSQLLASPLATDEDLNFWFKPEKLTRAAESIDPNDLFSERPRKPKANRAAASSTLASENPERLFSVSRSSKITPEKQLTESQLTGTFS